MRYDPERREATVMSGFGRSADWLRNIQAQSHPSVVIGRERFIANHRLLDEDEAARVFADYEHRNRFAAPAVRAVLSRLLGWKYHATDAERHQAILQLPLVAFYPHD
jgi:hypothetical protein